ncbi:MAG: fused MFS/spermidine synthase, partial [Candidatus Kuenenia stuttgartiensis]|nr:fused MFS/spermidine synthase [Candidatus Kuenenia stuttgartiensis]
MLKILSYVWPITLAKYKSSYSGELTIDLVNGTQTLNTKNANYSFDSLHRVFQVVLSKHLAPSSDKDKILLLGMGGGSVIQIIRKEMGLVNPILCVDIDPLMIEIAKKFFDLDSYQAIDYVVSDASTWVLQEGDSFDWIIVDLFIDNSIPDAFLTYDFWQHLDKHLRTGATLIVNTITALGNGKNEALLIAQYLQAMQYVTQTELLWHINQVWICKKV